MSKITFTGPLRYRLQSYAALSRLSISSALRHLAGRKRHPDWPLLHEIGIRFWQHQFTRALAMKDPAAMRAYFDSLQTRTGEAHRVTPRDPEPGDPPGLWLRPDTPRRDAVLLYFHGGGYAFDAFISDEAARLLAHDLGAPLFKPAYRLTPEHPHPAQAMDALAAYRAMIDRHGAERLIVIGDSAGGHLALMTLLAARDAGLPQPALAIGLSPWTDIGDRGTSLHAHDRYDLVAGWMTRRFADWLTAGDVAGMRAALSPIAHDFKGLAPLYLQGGGVEVMIDMIRDFARVQAANGARICLDTWPGMTHDFFCHGRTIPHSAAALDRIGAAVDAARAGGVIAPGTRSEVHSDQK